VAAARRPCRRAVRAAAADGLRRDDQRQAGPRYPEVRVTVEINTRTAAYRGPAWRRSHRLPYCISGAAFPVLGLGCTIGVLAISAAWASLSLVGSCPRSMAVILLT